MKERIIILSLTFAAFLGCNNQSMDNPQTVNSILGDISFIKEFGHPPDASTDEDLRIRTHLEYVERLLRERDCSSLTEVIQQRRHQLLEMLHEYWTANVFPRNYDFSGQRIPCFIDRDGRICAVGYLIERTVGRAVAEGINSKYKYENVLAMNDEVVDSWIATSGLTKEECAMIQPAYCPQNPAPETNNFITPGYGVWSSLLGATNLSLSTMIAIHMAQGSQKKAFPIIGLVTGAGQVILGATMMPGERQGLYGNTTNESQKILSIVNIGLGVTTMILSTWNLMSSPRLHSNNVGWSVYAFPTTKGDVRLGFSLGGRF